MIIVDVKIVDLCEWFCKKGCRSW